MFIVPLCGTVVSVELISRFLGSRNAKVALLGTSGGAVIYLAVGSIPVFLGLMLGALYFYQLIDSVMVANAINRKALRGETEDIIVEELPEFVKTGSVFWGVVLMILGVVLLMANFEFLINYDRIWDLWPLVVIIVGVKLVADYYAKSKEAE